MRAVLGEIDTVIESGGTASFKLRAAHRFLVSRSTLGFPWAIMVRVSGSRNTELLPMVNMLASSWAELLGFGWFRIPAGQEER